MFFEIIDYVILPINFASFWCRIYCQEKHYAHVNQLKEVQDRVKNITNDDYRIADTLITDDLTPDAIV